MVQESYHHGDLRSELIEQGVRLLDAEGYEGLSLRKVAKACNVSHAAPYRHFANKDELIAAIGLEVADKFGRCLQAAVDKHPSDPGSQLREMGFAYIKFFAENPAYLRLIFLSDGIWPTVTHPPQPGDSAPASTALPENGSPFGIMYHTVARYRAQAQSSNTMSQDELVLQCWGVVHGISMLIVRQQFPYPGDCLELARTMLWNESSLGR